MASFPESKECCFHCQYFVQDKYSKNDPCVRGVCHRVPPMVVNGSAKKGHVFSWFPFVMPKWCCGEFRKPEVVEV
jgi:hypothetical protein